MSKNQFENKFASFVNVLKHAEGSSFIELDKEKEIAYLEAAKFRFKNTFEALPSHTEPIRILDIGTTPFTLFIKECYPHYSISTLDLTNNMEQRCIAAGIQFKICDLAKEPLPFEDGLFDVVIFTEVLEHIFTPPNEVIREIRRVTRVGGKLIFSVPNIACLVNRLKLLFGISPLEDPNDQMKRGWVHGHGHLREYTMKEVTSILKACDFIISKKKFLQPGFPEASRGIKGVSILPFSAYYAVNFLVPSFRTVISIHGYKRK